jgi:hypothetical protein
MSVLRTERQNQGGMALGEKTRKRRENMKVTLVDYLDRHAFDVDLSKAEIIDLQIISGDEALQVTNQDGPEFTYDSGEWRSTNFFNGSVLISREELRKYSEFSGGSYLRFKHLGEIRLGKKLNCSI